MPNLVAWLVVGALLGWTTERLMRHDARRGRFLDVVAGVIDATLAGGFAAVRRRGEPRATRTEHRRARRLNAGGETGRGRDAGELEGGPSR